jgi:hypothetical protein
MATIRFNDQMCVLPGYKPGAESDYQRRFAHIRPQIFLGQKCVDRHIRLKTIQYLPLRINNYGNFFSVPDFAYGRIVICSACFNAFHGLASIMYGLAK